MAPQTLMDSKLFFAGSPHWFSGTDILTSWRSTPEFSTREVSLLFSSFWTSSSWRWSCNRCTILMSKNHPKEVGVFPLGCLKNMCTYIYIYGKIADKTTYTYIYIHALYAQIYEILTRCFDLPMLKLICEKTPHEICSRFCWLKESNGTPADPLFA